MRKKPEHTQVLAKGKKQGLAIGILEICAVFLVSALIWVYSPMLVGIMGKWSYLGIFFLSLLSSASILVPLAPMQLAIISLGSVLNPLFVGIIAGVGSAIGELSGFVVGRGSHKILKTKDKTANFLIKLQKSAIREHAAVAIFLLSLVPNPFFDIAGMLAGILKMRWQEFLLWCVMGRVLRYILIAYLGLWASGMVG